jgi:hypothetical protein
MIFAPGANQGPLAGMLLSGPGGAALGLILFVIFRALPASPAQQWVTLLVCCSILVMVTLYLIMPGPDLRGHIEDIQIESCKQPIEALYSATRYWEGQTALRPAAARSGWQEDSREMLQNDNGVILGVLIIREKAIFEEHKPWNRGRIVAADWRTVNAQKTFYARYAGGSCANYATGRRSLQFNDLYFYGVPRDLGWPPRKAPNFLNLQTLESIPEIGRGLTGN